MSKSSDLNLNNKEMRHKEHIQAADAHFAKKAKKKALGKAKGDDLSKRMSAENLDLARDRKRLEKKYPHLQ